MPYRKRAAHGPVLPTIALIALSAVAAPSQAAITDLTITGRRVVTYSQTINYDNGLWIIPGPPVGQSIVGNIIIHIGGNDYYGNPTAPPDGFTGHFIFDDYLLRNKTQYFKGFDIDSTWSGAYRSGFLDFAHGHLTNFGLFRDYDPDYVSYGNGGWSYGVREATGGWGGKFTVLPEPRSWALMTIGFGLAGGALRRRRAAARPLPMLLRQPS